MIVIALMATVGRNRELTNNLEKTKDIVLRIETKIVMLVGIMKKIVSRKIHLMNAEQRLVKRVYSPLSQITL